LLVSDCGVSSKSSVIASILDPGPCVHHLIVAIIVARTTDTITHVVRSGSGVSKGCRRSLPATQAIPLLKGQDTDPKLSLLLYTMAPCHDDLHINIQSTIDQYRHTVISSWQDVSDPCPLQYWHLPTAFRVLGEFLRALGELSGIHTQLERFDTSDELRRRRSRRWLYGGRECCNDWGGIS
jgi:hypothetical protein